MPELTVEADVQYVQWGAYKSLDLNYNVPPIPAGTSSQPQNWSDQVAVRVGGEYKYSPEITLRGGLIMDLTPQPFYTTTPMLPDADRTDISLGGSYKIDANWHVDAAYMLVLFADKKVNAMHGVPNPNLYLGPGTYSSTAHVLSVNVGYTF
jgi:long-chain fatty acid transport protein